MLYLCSFYIGLISTLICKRNGGTNLWWKGGQGIASELSLNCFGVIDEISRWCKLEVDRRLSREEIGCGDVVKSNFKRVALMEEIKWKQRTKIQWLKKGDNNTIFFS